MELKTRAKKSKSSEMNDEPNPESSENHLKKAEMESFNENDSEERKNKR